MHKYISKVCPACANMLMVSRTAPTDEHPSGANRLECRTCPYQFIIQKTYFERRYIKRKEVEDVMGGPGAWDNVDQTEGERMCLDPGRRCWCAGGSYLNVYATQYNARTTSATDLGRSSTRCRSGAPTSP